MASCNSTRPPSYRLHKASGQAVVTIDRKVRYLGVHGTPESRLRYERLISAWMQGEPVPAREPESSNDITVAVVCVQYLRWAESYYVKDGKETSELHNVKRAIKTLREAYAGLPAREFSPLKLKAVRQRFIDDGLCRDGCNRFTGIVARVFRYGVENELIPPDVAHGLEAVKTLAKGRCEAPETDPVLPVDQDTVDATLPSLDVQYRAMVKIQLLLACRPGELVTMRPREIDRSEAGWVYRPRLHKTMHHGKDRIIPIGPRAQLLLKPWLPDDPDRFCLPLPAERSHHRIRLPQGDLRGVRAGRNPRMVSESVATLRSNPDSPAGQSGRCPSDPWSLERPHDGDLRGKEHRLGNANCRASRLILP